MKFSNGNNKKSISFFSYHLNKEKFYQIKALAEMIRDYKNFISEIYYQDYFNKQHISCSDFCSKMKMFRDINFPAQLFQPLCIDVYNTYNKQKPPKKQVIFKKLSFTGVNCSTTKFIENSNNKYTNGIINLNIPKSGIVEIPFIHSQQYHGNLNNIKYSMNGRNKQQYQKQYQCIIGYNKIRIIIAVDDNRTYNPPTMNHIEGVDVNVKHNLLQCSDGYTIDYDRKMVKKILIHKKKQDRITSTKKKRGLSIEYTKKQLEQNKRDRRRSISMVEKCLVELFKHCNQNNVDHLVFEDLNKFTRKYKINDKEFNVNIRRLMSILHLVDIKNIAKRIGKKYGITISLTNAEYTSQQCSKCGCIHKDNRKTQEKFKCIHCGHEENADLNASKNIRNRISVDVLRGSLHTVVENNTYIPKTKNHNEVKSIFQSIGLM
jgi:transposase, IS605 orfB family